MSITAGQLPTWQGSVRVPRLASRTRVAWGRVVALLTLIAVSALLGAGIRAAAEPTRNDDGAVVTAPSAGAQHVVRPGDTLWAIAQAHAPGADPRETVDRIMRANGLESAHVEIGRVLQLP